MLQVSVSQRFPDRDSTEGSWARLALLRSTTINGVRYKDHALRLNFLPLSPALLYPLLPADGPQGMGSEGSA